MIGQAGLQPTGSDELWLPPRGIVIDRGGLPVDCSQSRWRLNDPTALLVLDWGRITIPNVAVLNSMRRYFAWLITAKNPQTVHNSFAFLKPFVHSKAFQAAALQDSVIPYLAFSETRDTLGRKQQWQLHHSRQYYRWCVTQGLPHFTREVLRRVAELVVGGNSKGQAVRSHDPDHGPLDAQEVAALTAALRAMRAEASMPLAEQAAVWLALSIGSNAGQFASLREEDVVSEELGGEVAAWILRIPRHKKGDVLHRTSFRSRRVDRFIGSILKDLIEENRSQSPIGSERGAARPLFRRSQGAYPPGDPLFEWTWHVTRGQFTNLLKRAIKRLRVRSRTGGPLNVSTRRFRYSLATRLVQNGASVFAVADALDHSDTQSVPVYFDVHSDIVEQLDRSMALALGPRAQAFAKVVRSESEAVRGNSKGSRRYFADREKDVFEPVGTCGAHSFCNITAPLACYTCVKFQAWMDGPHDLVLDSLLQAREGRASMGLSAKMVAIEDQLIAAVANVIGRIAELRSADA
jgi:integrase